MRKAFATTAIAVFALALAACSSTDGDGGGSELSELNIGYFPVVDAATAPRALDAGIFEDNGLAVTPGQTTGGAQAIPSLIAGEFDIVFSNYPSMILGASEGLPLQIISGNNVGNADHSVMVSADSDLTRPADLAGKKVAVSHLQNIGVLGISTVVNEDGGDASTIQYVELAFPDMQAALERGDIDAMWMVEPFMARALEGSHEVLFNLFTGPMESSPVSGWVTTREFAAENPDVLEAFQKSIGEAGEQLQTDEEALVDTVTGFTDVDEETVRQIALPTWTSEVDEEGIQGLSDKMTAIDFLEESYDVTPLLSGE